MKTIEERIAVLESHREGLKAATTFENYKAQQLAFVDFLIDDLKLEKACDDHTLNWIVKMETPNV